VAVSKLCCPLCWDFLGQFRSDRFGVRGCHSVVTPVELPGFIPLDAAKALLTTLRLRLYDALTALDGNKDKSHSRNNSAQSVGSVTSDSSHIKDITRKTIDFDTTGSTTDESSDESEYQS
jgi:hypothetical protein